MVEASKAEGAVSDVLARGAALGDALDRDNMLANLRRKMFAEEVPRSKIRRFELQERLGSGASGVVFAALDPQLERRVALKLLRTDVDDAGRERLLREAKTLARISHPNIVSVHEAGEFEGRVFIAMEYVEGQTLGSWLGEERRPWREVVEVFVQAGRGLAAAHEIGLVHRDFKPENVLRDASGQIRVADFGLARVADEPSPSSDVLSTLRSDEFAPDVALTATGTVVGTPAYLAPEVFAGAAASALSDQFSFGVALYEGLHGQRPFGGNSIAELVANMASGKRQEHPEASLPRWLVRLVDRVLSTDPRQRYPSMDAVVGDLTRDRRPTRTMMVVGVGAVGLGALAFATSENTPDPCAAAGTELAEVWNDDARMQIQRSFESTGHPDASSQFDRVRGRLDSAVEGWATLSRQNCSAAHSETPPAEAIIHRRSLCLDHVRFSVEASVEAFRDASTLDVVAAAPLMTPEPGHLKLCGGAEVVLEALAEPPPPEQREELQAIRRELARARNLRKAGEAEQASVLAKELVERATELEYPPARAEALINLAKMYVELKQPNDAADAYRRAIAAADRGRADRMRVEALAGLARKEADLGRIDEARVALEQAEAAFARTGVAAELAPDDLVLGHAWVAEEAGDYETAWARFEELANRTDSEDGSIDMHVTALSGMGRMLLERNEFASAQEVFDAAVTKAEHALGENHPLVGQLLSNVGATETRRGNLDEAETALERSLKIRSVYLGDDHPHFANIYSNLGAIAFQRGRYDEALARFDRAGALAAAQRPDHPVIATALHNRASVLSRTGRYGEALAAQQRVLDLRLAAHGEHHPRTASTRTGLAMTLLELDRPSDALEHLATAKASLLELFGPDHPDLVPTLLGLAQANLALGDLEGAAAALTEAIEPAKGEGVGVGERLALDYARAQLLVRQGRKLDHARSLAEHARSQAREARLDIEAEEITRWLALHFPQ